VSTEISIRPFVEADAPQVRALFIAVNRLLAPPDLRDAFEAYITRSLAEEIDRIEVYYGAREGGFWVAQSGDLIVVGAIQISAERRRRLPHGSHPNRRGRAAAVADDTIRGTDCVVARPRDAAWAEGQSRKSHRLPTKSIGAFYG